MFVLTKRDIAVLPSGFRKGCITPGHSLPVWISTIVLCPGHTSTARKFVISYAMQMGVLVSPSLTGNPRPRDVHFASVGQGKIIDASDIYNIIIYDKHKVCVGPLTTRSGHPFYAMRG